MSKNIAKMYLNKSVWDAALERIEWIYDEFEHIYVNFSGGKDSTVILYLTLLVAERRGRLPVNVQFTDQEAEWETVIDYIREVFGDDRIKPYWLQIPFKVYNATSSEDDFLCCWEEGVEWMRPQEPNAITENIFGTEKFTEIFAKFLEHYHPDEPACHISGVRCEESPARYMGLTMYETYKGETWGKVENKSRNHYAFYPVYDWSYTDVWKAIHDNGWPYCKIYDYMYQYGVPTRDMRVSNIHHETAVKTLFYLQEIEGETWEKATKRIRGINTAGQLKEQFLAPKKLPPMFKDWWEYRDHLIEKLLDESEHEEFRRVFAAYDERYAHNAKAMSDLAKCQISCVLVGDHDTKLRVFTAGHASASKNRGARSGRKN